MSCLYLPDLVVGGPDLWLVHRRHGFGKEMSMLEKSFVDGDQEEHGQDGDDAEAQD